MPANVSLLSWLPTSASGYFSQSPLLIHKITPLESILRRVYRVLFDLWRFRNRTPIARAGLTWWGLISNLQDAYRRTASIRIKRLVGNDYPAFIALNDTFRKAEIKALRKQVLQLPLRPVFSLIMPVQAPVPEFFRGTLDCVLGQIYQDWELLLVCGFSDEIPSCNIINEYRSKDVRIKLISVKQDVDLAIMLNSALYVAQGKFVACINQHGHMPNHALFFLAREINNYPDVDFIYTDDDSIDEANNRHDPRFKPDWNPELFFSCNYLGNLTLYSLARVKEVGGYRLGFDGAEDYDLSLRLLKNTPYRKIKHISRILYHSRAISQPSQAINSAFWGVGYGGELAHQSGKRALKSYFEGSDTIVEDGSALSLYRIKHQLPTQLPLVTLIVPTRDKVDILKKCIESIRQKTDYVNWEMLVVDNQSVEPETHTYFAQLQDDSRIRVILYDKPFNYSGLNNFAVQQSQGDILALVNNDVEVITNDWLTEMVSHAIRPEIGAVGAKLFYSNGKVQHAGVIIGLGGVAGHAHKYLKSDDHGYCHRAIVTQNLSAVTGACLVVRKICYQQVGGLDENNLMVAFNDIDFCLKLVTAGYRNVYTPYAQLYHHESISRGHDDTPEKQAVFVQEFEYMKNKWNEMLKTDPAYNPNLTNEFEDFSLSNNSVRHDFSPVKYKLTEKNV